MTVPIRAIQGVSLAEGSVPGELGFGINTNAEVVAAGGTTSTIIIDPTTGSKAAASVAIAGLGFILVRKAQAADEINLSALTAWYIPLVAA